MSSLAVKLKELDDDQLEEFVELFSERLGQGYHSVVRMGKANDKGRDVVGFLTLAKHEGPWHLYQCKRKTRGSALGLTEALVELGKTFFHHDAGAYRTLPTKYVFVAPRGVVGPLRDLILNPSDLRDRLLADWGSCCATGISGKGGAPTPLTPRLTGLIRGYDFGKVEYLSETGIVKHQAARPALSRVLRLMPEEAPVGEAPCAVQAEEIEYLDQLRRVYGEARGADFATVADVLGDAQYGPDLGDHRTRFFEAAVFKRFHRDNTDPDALPAFEREVYLGVSGVHRRHSNGLGRLHAVMDHASIMPAAIAGRHARVPVRQGVCHHLANEGTMKWMP